MSDWIKHDGKGMPVDGETLVTVRFRDGKEEEFHQARPAIDWGDGDQYSNWNHEDPSVADIIAYRVHTPTSEVSA